VAETIAGTPTPPEPTPVSHAPSAASTDSRDVRAAAGRALRQRVPRSSLGSWDPKQRPNDPLDVLEEQASSRLPELIPYRYARMAESPFGFFRGAAAIMAMDLSTTPVTGMRVQACGDAHASNFGDFATPERNLIFDVNDFDETLPGPWEWDVKRLCASLHVCARVHGFTRSVCDQIVSMAASSYRTRLLEYSQMRVLDVWYHRIDAIEVIAQFPRKLRASVARDVAKSQKNDNIRAAHKLTTTASGTIEFVEDPPLVVRMENKGFEWNAAISVLNSYRASLPDDRRTLFDRYTLRDVALKAVGVGSVGTACWVALFEGPPHSEGDPLILQVKEAQGSVLEPYAGASAFPNHGMRVVVGQRLTQSASDIFLGWCQGPEGRQYYVRQLWDSKGSANPLEMDGNTLSRYGALCAWTLARAHARTGDAAQISGYLGTSDTFDKAIVQFAASYADTNERDHAELQTAIKEGRIVAATPHQPVAAVPPPSP
jgi:uncharacterized protein (DUF2252 family)